MFLFQKRVRKERDAKSAEVTTVNTKRATKVALLKESTMPNRARRLESQSLRRRKQGRRRKRSTNGPTWARKPIRSTRHRRRVVRYLAELRRSGRIRSMARERGKNTKRPTWARKTTRSTRSRTKGGPHKRSTRASSEPGLPTRLENRSVEFGPTFQERFCRTRISRQKKIFASISGYRWIIHG